MTKENAFKPKGQSVDKLQKVLPKGHTKGRSGEVGKMLTTGRLGKVDQKAAFTSDFEGRYAWHVLA